jgi:hypothetical protein
VGSAGSHGPRPYTQRRASTVFLRIPAIDWVPVTHGSKTEFRATPNAVTQALALEPPTPVVAYRVQPLTSGKSDHDHRLMVMTETWQEPLGAISPESLEREGHADFAHFRRYWMQRTRRRFRPMQMVRVFRVRPFGGQDWDDFAARLMRKLYGEFA